MDYLLQGFGVFLGVIAGTAVTFLTQLCISRAQDNQKIENLKFEIKLNIKKLDVWLEELSRYRNTVIGDSAFSFDGYFDLSRIVSVTWNDLFFLGKLYKRMKDEEIEKLQVLFSDLSFNWETLLNQQIATNKLTPNKQHAIASIGLWEQKFKEHRKTLQNLSNKFDEK